MSSRHRSRIPTARRAAPLDSTSADVRSTTSGFWTRRRVWLAVVFLLAVHAALATASLVGENPTVDEVVHLPAGVTYWEKGTFKLYRNNPPLAKLVAAIPVVMARPSMASAYSSLRGWRSEYPAQSVFAQYFVRDNAERYLELFTLARLMMPLWSIVGGLVVFFWSRELYGAAGALLSLALWCLCPNILAHTRLITSDVAAASLGCAATYLFWRYLHLPTWRRALIAGLALGVAQLVKFSLLILYPLWPVLWLIHCTGRGRSQGPPLRIGRAAAQGFVMVATSVFVIDAAYLFDGVGTPLGKLPFASRSYLTREGQEPRRQTNPSGNPLIDDSWAHRVNRFRGTLLGAMPSPLPLHYLLGFDEQKIEADGVPVGWIRPDAPHPEEITGYPVYLDGVLRRHGWREYFVKCLLYKLPEGTWILLALAAVVTLCARRFRTNWSNELILVLMPLSVLGAMSFLTDINLGLRYVLPTLPYLVIFCGKLVPWAAGLTGTRRIAGAAAVVLPLCATAAATASIHPHYLAYFNWASGGAERGSEHLIDSNLDWGQDLVGLREWLRKHAHDEPVGLAYFGQISPNLWAARGDGFDWFIPPVLEGRLEPMSERPRPAPAPRLTPGLYAISATLYRGLPWRLYAPADPSRERDAWVAPAWNTREHAFAYFRELRPLAESIGHSILFFRISQSDADRVNGLYRFAEPPSARPPP